MCSVVPGGSDGPVKPLMWTVICSPSTSCFVGVTVTWAFGTTDGARWTAGDAPAPAAEVATSAPAVATDSTDAAAILWILKSFFLPKFSAGTVGHAYIGRYPRLRTPDE